jgi:broad specificity phosphatase PhoE
MRLILLRHGETVENVSDIIQGQSLGSLTKRGRRQAMIVGQYLKAERIDMIFSSDLPRVRDTLKAVMVYHPMVPVLFSADLRERAIGVYEGRPKQAYFEVQAKSGISFIKFRPEGGESFLDMQARTDRLIARLKSGYLGKTVLVCTHGGPIRTLLARVLNMPLEELLAQSIENASLTTLEFSEEGEPMRCLLNSVQHLASEAAPPRAKAGAE